MEKQDGSRKNFNYGYQGEFSEEDEETGYNHFELRDYDPVIGRWMIKDPMRQFWSPYIGMGNNAINMIDPDGGCIDYYTGVAVPCPEGMDEIGNASTMILSEVNIQPQVSYFPEVNLTYPTGMLGTQNMGQMVTIPEPPSISPLGHFPISHEPEPSILPEKLPEFNEIVANVLGTQSTIWGGAFNASVKQAGNLSKIVAGIGNTFAVIGAVPATWNLFAGYYNGHIKASHMVDAGATALIIGASIAFVPAGIALGIGYAVFRISKGDIWDKTLDNHFRGYHFR